MDRFVRLFLICLFAAAGVHAQPAADPWEADIAAFEKLDAQQPPQPGGIVFIGSSSIRYWTTLAEDFPGVAIVNRGFGGSQLRDSTRFVERVIVPHKPRLVVLYAGDNDLAEGRTPSQVEDDFAAFIEAVRRDDAQRRVAIISIKPSPARRALLPAARDANARLQRVAAAHAGVSYIDIFTPMLDADGEPRAELFLDDRLHITRDAYRLWADAVRPHLK